MTRLVPGLLSIAVCLVGSLQANQGPLPSAPFVVRAPDTVDTARLQITYRTDGCGDFVRVAPGTHTFSIDTACQGKPASAFKAIAWLPGFAFELVEADLTAPTATRAYALHPTALAPVVVTGHVTAPDGVQVARQELDIVYGASWACDFFGEIDCMVATFKVPPTAIGADGSFRAEVPDVAHDPAVTRFGPLGGFFFVLFEPQRRQTVHLAVEGQSDGSLPASATYPSDVALAARTASAAEK